MAVAAPKLADLLLSARRRAWHLELRDAYARTPRFLAWQSRTPHDRSQADAEWHALLAPLRTHGGDLRRLRVISEPISEYVRYEYEVTPLANLPAGEQVRWLPRVNASDLRFPGNDFWLVDDRLLFNLQGGDGDSLGVQPNDDPQVIEFCAESFQAAWQRAIDHNDYRPA